MSVKHAILLDADGVLWPDKGSGGILDGRKYAYQSLSELRSHFGAGHDLFVGVVTNQTYAARSQIDYVEFSKLIDSFFHDLISRELINDFRVCFHHPRATYTPLQNSRCMCRKPRPGMILDLLEFHHLDPRKTVMIGDRITDMLAAKMAGIKSTILLYGEKMFEMNEISGIGAEDMSIPLRISKDLSEAAHICLNLLNND